MEKPLLLLMFTVRLTSAATHTLQCFITGVKPAISFPEFTAVGQLDEEQIGYFDSNSKGVIVKADWLKKSNDEEHWKTITKFALERQELVRVRLDKLMELFNQTEGVHTLQEMYSCEMDDDGTKRGYRLFGFDGEDFLSLDLNSTTWTAAVPQAVSFKQPWENGGVISHQKHFLETICIEWLQKYVGYSRSTLERKVPPQESLFQKDSSSPVVCHATGFFPKSVLISWHKNGEELHEDVEIGETLPNHDGTFQKRSLLTVSPEELHKHNYTCVVHHEGLQKKLQVSDLRVLSGGGSGGLILGVVVAVLLLVIVGCVGVFMWRKKKKKSGFAAVPVSSTSDSVQYSNPSPNPNPSSLC